MSRLADEFSSELCFHLESSLGVSMCWQTADLAVRRRPLKRKRPVDFLNLTTEEFALSSRKIGKGHYVRGMDFSGVRKPLGSSHALGSALDASISPPTAFGNQVRLFFCMKFS